MYKTVFFIILRTNQHKKVKIFFAKLIGLFHYQNSFKQTIIHLLIFNFLFETVFLNLVYLY